MSRAPHTGSAPQTGSASLALQARALLALTRPVNMLIAIVGTIAAGIVAGLTRDGTTTIVLAAAAAALVGAAGNMINDVFDVAIDRVNKPHRAIAAGTISTRTATIAAVALAAAGLIAAALVSLFAFSLAVASVVLLYLYSASFKRMPLVGNLTVGLITGAVFLLGAAAAGDITAGIIPALFACGVNIGREILKDVEDMHGDREAGVRTFPLDHGVEAALLLAAVVFGLVVAASPLPWLLAGYSFWYLVIVLPLVDTVVILCMLRAYQHPTTQTLRRINSVLKIAMISGIAAIVVGTVTKG